MRSPWTPGPGVWGCALAGVLAVAGPAWSETDPGTQSSEPPAAVGAPTPEEQAYAAARAAAEAAYGACLQEQDNGWFTAADYTRCDAARSEYARYLPADAASVVAGCLEEEVIGEARVEGQGCAAMEARFVEIAPLVTADEEDTVPVAGSTEAGQ